MSTETDDALVHQQANESLQSKGYFVIGDCCPRPLNKPTGHTRHFDGVPLVRIKEISKEEFLANRLPCKRGSDISHLTHFYRVVAE